MKSAYELALERMAKECGPSRTLSEDQKARMAEIDRIYAARIAEHSLAHEARLQCAGPGERLPLIERYSEDLAALERARESEKDRIWNESSAPQA